MGHACARAFKTERVFARARASERVALADVRCTATFAATAAAREVQLANFASDCPPVIRLHLTFTRL